MAAKTFSKRGYRSFLRHEQLESRVMLSASPSDVDSSVAEVSSAVVHAPPKAAFELRITGTGVEFSELGLPSSMSGTIAFVAPNGRSIDGVGLYHETLTPIFMDVNGDTVPDFVGTNGVATFSFYGGAAHNVFIGSITTVNTSYIQGVTAAGEMIVGSTGTITACDGMFKRMSGGFTSQSVVAMFPAFAMQTTVNFVVSDYRLDARFGAKIMASVATSIAEACDSQIKAKLVDAIHGNADKHDTKPGKHASKSDNNTAPARHAVDRLVEHAKDRGDHWSSKRHDRLSSDLAGWRLGAAC